MASVSSTLIHCNRRSWCHKITTTTTTKSTSATIAAVSTNHRKSSISEINHHPHRNSAPFESRRRQLWLRRRLYDCMPVLWKIIALMLFFVSLGGSVTADKSTTPRSGAFTAVALTTEINAQTSLPPQLQEAASVVGQTVNEHNYSSLLVAVSTTNVTSKFTTTKLATPPTTTGILQYNATESEDFNYRNNIRNSSISTREVDAGVATTTNEYWQMETEVGMVMGLGAFTAATSMQQLHNVSLATEAFEETDIELPPLHTIIVSLLLLLVIVGTVVGNVLVCIAVCMVRKLRRPCNYLLVSLALSDLCVAVLVMPIALLYEVLEKWNFGPVVCDIWVSFDVLCCTASILNLCAISVDRYLAITKPLEYGVKRTPRRMMLCVALVWLGAACISLPPLLILGNVHVGEMGEPKCNVCQNFGYQIYATLGSFYIPLAVMLFVYFQIFRAARRIVLEEKRAQTHLQHALNGTGSPSKVAETGGSHLHLGSGTGDNGHRNSSFGNTSLLNAHGTGSTLLGSPHQKKLRFQLAKEKKASTTLGIIMSAFTICWLPFFILALIRPFESTTYHVPQSINSLFLWLGYANSLLNPIIYATLNRDFRKPFQEILYFRCSSLNTMMRENYYHDQYGEPPSQRVTLGDERHGARESFL